MKKGIFIGFGFLVLFLLPIVSVGAEEGDVGINSVDSNIKSETLPDSARSLPSSGQFSPKSKNNSLAASCTPTYQFEVETNDPFFSDPNAFAQSWAYENCGDGLESNDIELVYARGKLYKDGAFLASDSDTTNYGNYAGIKASASVGNTVGLESYGEHKFRQSGYMEHNFNTYDEL